MMVSCDVARSNTQSDVLMVSETVTVIIIQSAALKQSYSYSFIWRLTVSVHPLSNIQIVQTV